MRRGVCTTAATILSVGLSAWACEARHPAPPAPRSLVFEYAYEFNTDALNENHYLVFDSVGGRLRGWYYGTSDEFDVAREGYLPGFFVAEMLDLVVSGDRVEFLLPRPDVFFAGPVPREYRSSADVPAGALEPWAVPLPLAQRAYSGTWAADRIALDSERGVRMFQRISP